jgi:hypothetical protein
LNSGTSTVCHSLAKASLAIMRMLTGASAVPSPPPSDAAAWLRPGKALAAIAAMPPTTARRDNGGVVPNFSDTVFPLQNLSGILATP